MSHSFPKILGFVFLFFFLKKRDLPRGGGSLAAGWRMGHSTGPADDIAFSQTRQLALSCIFPYLVDRAPGGLGRQGKGLAGRQKGPRSQEDPDSHCLGWRHSFSQGSPGCPLPLEAPE